MLEVQDRDHCSAAGKNVEEMSISRGPAMTRHYRIGEFVGLAKDNIPPEVEATI